MTKRQTIRKAMRDKRNALSDRDQQAAACAVAHHLSRLPEFQRASTIAAYVAVNGEVDLGPVIQLCLERGKTIALPVVRGRKIEFHAWSPDTPMQLNAFGIPEPKPGRSARLSRRFLDIVLAPLVAFDLAGGRLGMGGGFYDRGFAFLRQRCHWQRPHLLGIAHAFQRADALPVEAWDVPLHGVITELAHHRIS